MLFLYYQFLKKDFIFIHINVAVFEINRNKKMRELKRNYYDVTNN